MVWKKDSATMDQELPALFRCDKNMKPKTGQFGIQFPDRFSIYFELKMVGEAEVELAEIPKRQGKARNIPTEGGSWETRGSPFPSYMRRFKHIQKKFQLKRGKSQSNAPTLRRTHRLSCVPGDKHSRCATRPAEGRGLQ